MLLLFFYSHPLHCWAEKEESKNNEYHKEFQ